MRLRRQVLGDAHVDRAEAARDEFDDAFQSLVTRFAWGDVWTREELPLRTRSLLTLALMVALGRERELRMHVRAARRNGVTETEIREVLLHCAVYCGLPAANDAFAVCKEVLAQDER
jgi:4-carboxymuconolactone decarboxylase